MDKCLSFLEPRTFNKPAFAGLIIFAAAGLFLPAALLGVEMQEESEFKCYDDLPEELRDRCYDTYNSQYNRGFPLYGFAILNFSLVLFVCLVYSLCVKQRVGDLCDSKKIYEENPSETTSLQLQSPPSRKLFTAYVIHLLARVVSLAIFFILQWIVVYPIKFPKVFDCVGTNFTANFSISTPAHHNCRNSQAEMKTGCGIALFVVNALFFVLSLVEGARLIWKAVNDKTFTEDRKFLVRHLIGNQSEIPPGVQRFVILLRRRILKDTEYIMPLGPGKIKNRIKMDDTFVDLTIQTDRKVEQFSNPDRDAIVDSYARPGKGSLTLGSTELFASNTDTQDPCTILAVGRPGIGKTSLATKILRDWAKRTANQGAKCFDFVFLLQFRWLNSENNMSLKKLLSLSPYSVNFTDEVFKHILESPEKVLLVFDGLDEAKKLDDIETERQYENSNIEEMPVGALFAKLTSGKLLDGATVLTTTRSTAIPGVVERFYNGVNDAKLRLVEILGFTPDRVQQYVNKIAPEDTKNRIWNHINSNANLLSLCYIPVNCFVMCTFFTNLLQNIRKPGAAQVAPQSSHRLPTTLTEIYRGALQSFILNHHSSYQIKNPERDEYDPNSKFRPEIEETLKKLGELAKKGLEEGRLIFGKKEIEKQGLTAQEVKFMVESSLLHHLPEGNSEASTYEEQYCFIHLTFQEFLAARNIANQNAEELGAFASSASTENSKMQIVLRFVAGLLRCQESSERVDSLLKPLITNSLEQRGVVSHKLMFLLHCLFELQSEERVKMLSSRFKRINELKLQIMKIDDADCASLVFFLKHTTGVNLNLSLNRIGPNGCAELAKLVTSGNLSVLQLNMNTSIGDEGMESISEALKKGTCKLRILAISYAGITALGAKHVSEALKSEHCQLTSLILGSNQLTDKGAEYLGDALVTCKLKVLDVTSASISAVGAKHFSNALKSQQCQLRRLYLKGNQVTDEDVKRLGNVNVIDLTRFPITLHCQK